MSLLVILSRNRYGPLGHYNFWSVLVWLCEGPAIPKVKETCNLALSGLVTLRLGSQDE